MTNPSPDTPVILCADDFGISPGVSEGILEAANAGRISAVSCIVGTSDFRTFGPQLAALDGKVSSGLHLLLTDLEPIGTMPVFAPQGTLPRLPTVLKGALGRSLPTDEIAAEISRQLETFEEVMGHPPAFIDGHQHVHQFPGIRDLVIEAARALPGPAKPWIRVCHESVAAILKRGVDVPRALYISWFGRELRRRATSAGLRSNRGFSGVYDFSGKVPYADLFERFTEALQPNSLIMCHPGRVDDVLRARDSLTDQRTVELDYFLGDRFTELLAKKSLKLGPLDE